MKFSKIFLAALLAVVAGSIISFFVWMIIFFSVAGSMGSSAPAIKDSSVLKIDFADIITDAPQQNPLAGLNLQTMQASKNITLLNVLRSIESAKSDDRIKGIYINITGGGSVNSANTEEIRAAVEDFKQSGKFVIAYGDAYSQGGYFFSTVADAVYLQPEGGVAWNGLAGNVLFYKDAMDKLGLKAEIFRPSVCKFKSAVEPYFLSKMSDANRLQMQQMVDQMWAVITTAVSEARGISVEELNRIADNLECNTADDALRLKMVDGLMYADQIRDLLVEKGVGETDGEINEISLGEYCSLYTDNSSYSSDKIGIVYAEGEIVDGEGNDNVYGTTMAATIAKARKDKSIKAVVFRVNSPGGSALASDIIWREVELLKAEKPVIVSMGEYAASGGYYISCPADAIVADKLTLTGSIGVFGMRLVNNGLINNTLHLNIDGVKTNKSGDMGQSLFGMVGMRNSTEAEIKTMLRSVDKVYDTFTSKVANGRNLKQTDVFEIAEGRVWSGTKGVEIGLVDANGGLKQAIAIAAEKAGLENFRLYEVLDEPNALMAFLQSVNAKVRAMVLSPELQNVCQGYEQLKSSMLNHTGIQAYCPYRVSL